MYLNKTFGNYTTILSLGTSVFSNFHNGIVFRKRLVPVHSSVSKTATAQNVGLVACPLKFAILGARLYQQPEIISCAWYTHHKRIRVPSFTTFKYRSPWLAIKSVKNFVINTPRMHIMIVEKLKSGLIGDRPPELPVELELAHYTNSSYGRR